MQKIKWEKNLTAYVLWLCLLVAVSCSLAAAGRKLLNGFGVSDLRACAVFALVCLLAEAWLCFSMYIVVLRRQGRKETVRRRLRNRPKEAGSRKTWRLWETAAVLWLLLLRIGTAAVYGMELTGDTALYELARVTETGTIPRMAHNASYLYTLILSTALRFGGNKEEAAVFIQLLLQTAAILLFYTAVRKLLGRGVSVVFLLFASVLPDFLWNYHVLSADILLCITMGSGLSAAASLLQILSAGKRREILLPGLFTGILAGISTWLDLSGMILWLAVCIGILQLAGIDSGAAPAGEGKPVQSAAGKRMAAVCTSLGFVISLAFLFAIESGAALHAAADGFRQYCLPYIQDIRLAGMLIPDGPGLAAALLLNLLAGMAVFGFWKQDYDRTAVPAVLLFGITALECINMTQVSYRNLENFFWLLAACAGISYLADAFAEKRAKEQESYRTAQPDGRPAAEEETMTDHAKGRHRPEQDKEKPEINYIPNPLPLPKKHVKKAIRFDLEPAPEQMKFDWELQEGKDDFDL